MSPPAATVAPAAADHPHDAPFWTLATLLGLLFFCSAAPSPLYIVYQAEWGFSALVLTFIFAVYVFTLMTTLLFVGAMSDVAGRKPVILLGISIQTLAMAVFALATGTGWLIAARVLQGLATGIATGAITAGLIDHEPRHRPALGGVAGSVAPPLGQAAGAIIAGALVQFGPWRQHLVFWLMFAAFAIGLVAVARIPESVVPVRRMRHSVRLRIGIPPYARATVLAIAPGVAASWALAGLYLSLGPSLVAGILGLHSHLVGGLAIAALLGPGGTASILLQKRKPVPVILSGLVLLMVGVVITLLALRNDIVWLFFVGTAIGGVGFGPTFMAAFKLLAATAAPDERAELISAVYALSYLSFSVPALIAGLVVSSGAGLLDTAYGYGCGLLICGVLAMVMTVRQFARAPVAAG